ncbi:MAG: single-stranded DNA-binding protein [Puniceicoccales bacterium]|jgi:single-strand DNA-binding protein|nr:single-stranded DNA-binding protein [Puniceicoccales bacterium]
MVFFNKVILAGNLTRDPESRVIPNGTPVCRFTLAVSRQFKNADGSSREDVVFIDVDSFGRQADTISRFMTKGKPILVEGRLKLDQWETPNGEKRSKILVMLENFQFLSSPPPGKGGEGGPPSNFQQENNRRNQRPAGGRGPRYGQDDEIDKDMDDEDILY